MTTTRWQGSAFLVLCPLLLFLGAGESWGQLLVKCVERNERLNVTEYAVALSSDSWRSRGPSVSATAVVLVKAANEKVYPVAGGSIDRSRVQQSPLLVQCDYEREGYLRRSGFLLEVTLTPKSQARGSVDALLDRLDDFSQGRPIPFRQAESRPLFVRLPNRPTTLPNLVEDYLKTGGGGDAGFLFGYPWPVQISIPQANGFTSQWSATNQQPTTTVQSPPPPQIVPSGPGAAPDQVAVPTHNATFKIDFRRRDVWQNVNLEEPGLIVTFGYCNDPKKQGSGYFFLCTPAADGKVPLRIRGFKDVSISQVEAAIDDRLEVAGFRNPYPPSWGRGSTDFVDVPSGRLSELLSRSFDIDQGIRGTTTCVDKTKPIDVAAILNHAISFPEPPCHRYEIVFQGGLTSPSAQIRAGCLAGAEISVPVRNGRVSCWYSRHQPASITLKLDLLPGFGQIVQPLGRDAVSQGTINLTFDQLARALVPIWPYNGPSLSEIFYASGEAPRYFPEALEYTDNAGRRCSPVSPVPTIGSGKFEMATLADAGCNFVPSKAKITFKQVASGPNSPPSEAFVASYFDEYTIADTRPRGIAKLDDLKIALPAGFSPADGSDYNKKFGTGAGNSSWPGVYVFRGECTRPTEGRFINFREIKGEFKWPLSAAVFDGKIEEPLTICAPAKITKDGGSKPFFTFKLEGTRAVGPRRVIVIANSQGFAKQAGTVPALQEALGRLVDAAYEAYKSGAPLSPITVYSVDGQDNYKLLFTGEQAAIKRDQTKRQIGERLDRAATATPDFQSITFQPEVKGNLEKVIFVMDGSLVSQNNKAQLALLANQLTRNNPGNLAFYVTSNSCDEWRRDAREFDCFQLGASQPARRDMLANAFLPLVRAPADITQDGPNGLRGNQPQ
ncbi:MAG: hypothetical protein GHHEDOFH_00859 [Pseudorhodoplanes sp.]|nr:hypothetical protein [Pseudorhodoplanes sp.]